MAAPTGIQVTKTYLPPLDTYQALLREVWERGWVTNNGPLVRELERQLAQRLGAPYFAYTANGTVALQLLFRAFELQGSVVTTPFSYVATTNALLWEGLEPVFADIDPRTLQLDAASVAARIRPDTTAILATHVYGYPSDHAALKRVAEEHGLKLLYDAAHAFDSRVEGRQIGTWGDGATYSFHATKYFHTIEGGGIVLHDADAAERLQLLRAFGHEGRDYRALGINGKNSEFHAGIGLLNLPLLPEVLAGRKALYAHYRTGLSGLPLRILSPADHEGLYYNYAYFPLLFEGNRQRERCVAALEEARIFPRRYFEPALNQLPFLRSKQSCPVAEDAVSRVLCLPFYHQLAPSDADRILRIIRQNLEPCA